MMKHRFRINFILPLLIASLMGSILASCSTQQVTDTAQVLLRTKVADTLIQSGVPAQTVFTADLTDQERDRITTALDVYASSRAKWAAAAESGVGALSALLTVANDYAILYGEYMAVHQIVAAHWNEYDPVQQRQLQGYHAQAQALHASVSSFLQAQQPGAAATEMLTLGLIIAQTAAL